MTREMNKPEWHNMWVNKDCMRGCKNTSCGHNPESITDVFTNEFCYMSPEKYNQIFKSKRVLNPLIAEFFERCCKMERFKQCGKQ